MKKVIKQVGKYVDPTVCLTEVIFAYTEYLKIAEQEKTTRCKISAWEQINVQAIQSQQEVIVNYLDRTFDERSKNFDELFQRVDVAMENKDNEQLSQLLGAIVDLVKTNPFSNYKTFQAKFDDPDHVWEF